MEVISEVTYSALILSRDFPPVQIPSPLGLTSKTQARSRKASNCITAKCSLLPIRTPLSRPSSRQWLRGDLSFFRGHSGQWLQQPVYLKVPYVSQLALDSPSSFLLSGTSPRQPSVRSTFPRESFKLGQ